MFYDWSFQNRGSDDPRFPNGPPHGEGKVQVFVDGRNVSSLHIFRVEDGPKGLVSFYIKGAKGEAIEFPEGQILQHTIRGHVRIEFPAEAEMKEQYPAAFDVIIGPEEENSPLILPAR